MKYQFKLLCITLLLFFIAGLKSTFAQHPIEIFMNANPTIANETVWTTEIHPSPHVELAYPDWDSSLKNELHTMYDNILSGNYPTYNDPIANLLPTDDDNAFWNHLMSYEDAKTMYLSYLATSLYFEINTILNWSLTDYSIKQIRAITHWETLLRINTAFDDFPHTFYPKDNRSLNAPPAYLMTSFFESQNIIASTAYRTYANILEFSKNLKHFSGGNNYGNADRLWQFRGAIPVSRIIEGTYATDSNNFGRYTAGCHGTAYLHVGLCRLINLPAYYELRANHGTIRVPTIDNMFVTHMDEPYNQAVKLMNIDYKHLLVNKYHYDSYNEIAGVRGIDLDMAEIPNYKLQRFCTYPEKDYTNSSLSFTVNTYGEAFLDSIRLLDRLLYKLDGNCESPLTDYVEFPINWTSTDNVNIADNRLIPNVLGAFKARSNTMIENGHWVEAVVYNTQQRNWLGIDAATVDQHLSQLSYAISMKDNTVEIYNNNEKVYSLYNPHAFTLGYLKISIDNDVIKYALNGHTVYQQPLENLHLDYTVFAGGEEELSEINRIVTNSQLTSSGTCSVGQTCDDGDECTDNDIYDSNCNCVGTPNSLAGSSCDDGDECTINDVYTSGCICLGTFADEDSDGVCDANDVCPGEDDSFDYDEDDIPDACDNCDGNIAGTSCDDGDVCTTGDVYDADCNCAGTFEDTDSDGVCDANDVCPGEDDTQDSDGDSIPDACDYIACNTCQTVITTFPHIESFEGDLSICQNVDDDIDWTKKNGWTSSSNTGPSSAHEGSYYFYTEASSNPYKTAILQGACYDFSTATSGNIDFWYHMYGTSMGNLTLEISIDNGIAWISIWELSGNQGDAWNNVTIDLTEFAGNIVTYRFVGITGQSYHSDMAIDYITIDASGGCTAGTSCDDGDDCTTGDVYDSNCNCAGTFTDADNDSVCDANDICPGGDDTVDSDGDSIPDACDSCDNNIAGTSCDDGDDCTTGDVYDSNCNCAGTFADADNDSVCDANDICPGGDDTVDSDGDSIPDACDSCDNNLAGTSCDDGDDCTTGDVYDSNCNCAGTFADADNDGVCDADDICPGGDDTVDTDNDGIPDACDNCSTVGQSCDDGNACTTGDVYDADCNCAGTVADADNDGVCDADDICPGGDDTVDTDNDGIPDACDNCSTVGQSCDDGNACTTGDVYDASCNCVGTFADADNDGVCDADDICPEGDDTIDTDNDGTPDACDNCSTVGQSCDDGNACTTGDVYDANCNCAGTFADADNDGVCDADDICPGGDDTVDTDNDGIPDTCDNCSTVGQSCDDGNACTTGDVYDASCNCIGTFADADNDGICDADDICPEGDDTVDTDNDGTPDACDNCSTVGQSCDDGNACTTGDVYDADCNCAGTVADADNDGVCDAEDICASGDDNLDTDGDGTPDACDCSNVTNAFPSNPLTHAGTGTGSTTLNFSGTHQDVSFTISNINSKTNGPSSRRYTELVTVTYVDGNGATQTKGTYSANNYSSVAISIGEIVQSITVILTDGGDGNSGSSTMNISFSEVTSCENGANPPCSDADGDTVCDADDVCPGGDDTIDSDGDGTPDACETDGCDAATDNFSASSLSHTGNGTSSTTISFNSLRNEVAFTISGLNGVTGGKQDNRFIEKVTVRYVDANGNVITAGTYRGDVTSSATINITEGTTSITVILEDQYDGNTSKTLNINLGEISSCIVSLGGSLITNSDRNRINSPSIETTIEEEKAWSIYPNPSNNNLFIANRETSIEEENIEIFIFSTNGQTVATYTRAKNNVIKLDMSQLKSGYYFIRLVDKQKVMNFKWLKID